jgi:hypothetical protein
MKSMNENAKFSTLVTKYEDKFSPDIVPIFLETRKPHMHRLGSHDLERSLVHLLDPLLFECLSSILVRLTVDASNTSGNQASGSGSNQLDFIEVGGTARWTTATMG